MIICKEKYSFPFYNSSKQMNWSNRSSFTFLWMEKSYTKNLMKPEFKQIYKK